MTRNEEIGIDSDRAKLVAEIEQWRRRQLVHMPKLAEFVGEKLKNSDQDIEDQKLWLPSDLDDNMIAQHDLQDVAKVELELRKGEAYDTLNDVRAAVSHELQLGVQKRRHARKGAMHTRATALIRDAAEYKRSVGKRYIVARAAIVSLDRGLQSTFPILRDVDLDAKLINTGSELGGGRKTDSWIWTVGVRAGDCDAEWEDNGQCHVLDLPQTANSAY